MRTLYRTLVEVRALGRRRDVPALLRNFEACWVASLIDLNIDDLVSDAHLGNLPVYIRSAGLRAAARGPSISQLRAALGGAAGKRTNSTPPHVQAVPDSDRLLGAAGMALAAKSLKSGSAVLAFAQQADLSAIDWGRLLALCGTHAPPLVLVLLGAVPQRSSRPIELQRIASKAGLPGAPPSIQVDAGDAVALYRVAQESLLRVRTGGGPVVVECVPSRLDPIALLGRQLLARGICTRAWLASVDTTVAGLLARL